MKLVQMRLSNFQSYGKNATTINLDDITFFIGSNGTGKTAVMQALARMFSVDSSRRKIRRTDFHVSASETKEDAPDTRDLWIEAIFEFPEAADEEGLHASIPANFAHMELEDAEGPPRVVFRLEAELDEDGEIEEIFTFVISADEDGDPIEQKRVQKQDRNAVQVHYLPARRDPADQISYAANSMLGRVLRAAVWNTEKEAIAGLTATISNTLSGNAAVSGVGTHLASYWSSLHKGSFYASPSLSFERSEIEGLLRHLSVGFTPGHHEEFVDFSRLSDGQQSLLYVSLVLAVQEIGRKVLSGELSKAYNVDKLRPAIFTLIAVEEPENSLSPHYLGRIVKALTTFSASKDAQSVVATHAPSMLKRVAPENIRYLRLNSSRETIVKTITMPKDGTDAYKYVREAVQAFPELYFSRLVIFGEGDSEEIVLPRLLQANGLDDEEASISVVPLGGRHVNHFWRLTHALGIPHVTLLDLDLGRYQGGWGRVKYVADQLLKFPPKDSKLAQNHIDKLEKWNGPKKILEHGDGWLKYLESVGVFFSSPLDLDFMMILHFPEAYDVDMSVAEVPDEDTIAAVLGKKHGDSMQYSEDERAYFDDYHRRFKLGSKPAWHLKALASQEDAALKAATPDVLERMFKVIKEKLKELPE
jgi:putative ATP-dependent endonuclease of OLD family